MGEREWEGKMGRAEGIREGGREGKGSFILLVAPLCSFSAVGCDGAV